MKHVVWALLTVGLVVALSGCGVLQTLTTKHYAFSYNVPAPPALDSVVGTKAGQPLTVDTSVNISDSLVTNFDRYHGGVDWAGLSYSATMTRGSSIGVNFLVSTAGPVGSGATLQAPADAVRIESFTLTTAAPRVTVAETETTPNPALRTFMETAVRNAVGSLKIYLYFQITAPSGGHVTLSAIKIQGLAHGSLF